MIKNFRKFVKDYDIFKVIPHPDFRISSYQFLFNDIALVVLKERISFNVLIQPACLPTFKQDRLVDATVVSHGRTENQCEIE